MRPLKAVRAAVLNSMRRLDTETIPFDQGVGRVLAEAVVSIEDVPQFANSAMDGFAVRAADVSEPDAVLEVVADLPAGQVASVSLGEGQAIRIMTGAPMPDGADTVVRVEDTAEGYAHVHAGVHGIDDLVPSMHDWRNPTAYVTIKRIP